MLPNCPEFLFIWFGSAKVGAVEVPVNTSYKGEFLRHLVDQSDSKVLFIAREWLDRLKLIEDDLKKLKRWSSWEGSRKRRRRTTRSP